MKLKKLAAVLGLGLVSAAAQAGYIQAWDFQDDSIEFILREKTGGGFDIVTSGPVLKGDIFVAVFEMQSASANPPGVSLIPPGKELTGVSVIQLATDDPSANPIWTFLPYTGGMNAILSLVGHPGVIGGNAGGGAVAAMWLNSGTPTNTGNTNPAINDRDLVLDAGHSTYGDTTNCTSFMDCLTEASLGNLFQVDGLWGVDDTQLKDPDNRWRAIAMIDEFPPGGIDYGTVKSGAKTTQFASFSARLSNLWNTVEPVLFQESVSGVHCPGATHADADGCVQVRVTGQILGGAGLVNGAVGRNDIDARKLVQVPEPATLGLLGLGLLGLGLFRRRQA